MVVFATYVCEDCLAARDMIRWGQYRTCPECGGRMKRVEDVSDVPVGNVDARGL